MNPETIRQFEKKHDVRLVEHRRQYNTILRGGTKQSKKKSAKRKAPSNTSRRSASKKKKADRRDLSTLPPRTLVFQAVGKDGAYRVYAGVVDNGLIYDIDVDTDPQMRAWSSSLDTIAAFRKKRSVGSVEEYFPFPTFNVQRPAMSPSAFCKHNLLKNGKSQACNGWVALRVAPHFHTLDQELNQATAAAGMALPSPYESTPELSWHNDPDLMELLESDGEGNDQPSTSIQQLFGDSSDSDSDSSISSDSSDSDSSDSDDEDDCPRGIGPQFDRAERKSPPRPAEHPECQNKVRTGKDGKLWKSVKVYSNVHDSYAWEWRKYSNILKKERKRSAAKKKAEERKKENARKKAEKAKKKKEEQEKKRMLREEKKQAKAAAKALEQKAKAEKRALEKQAKDAKKEAERQAKAEAKALEKQAKDAKKEAERQAKALTKKTAIRTLLIETGMDQFLPAEDASLEEHQRAKQSMQEAVRRLKDLDPKSSMEELLPTPKFGEWIDRLSNGTIDEMDAVFDLYDVDRAAFEAGDRRKKTLLLVNAHKKRQKQYWKASSDENKDVARELFRTRYHEYCVAYHQLHGEYPNMPEESKSGTTDNDIRREVIEMFGMDEVNAAFESEINWSDVIGETRYCAQTVRNKGVESKKWATAGDGEYVPCMENNECANGFNCESIGLRQDYEKFIFGSTHNDRAITLNKASLRPFWFTPVPDATDDDDDDEEEDMEQLRLKAARNAEPVLEELRRNVFNRLHDELRQNFEVSPYVGVLVAGELDENAEVHTLDNMHPFGKGYFTYGYVSEQQENGQYRIVYIGKKEGKHWVTFPYTEQNVPEEVVHAMVKAAHALPLLETSREATVESGLPDRPSFDEFGAGFDYFFTTFFPRFKFESLHYNTDKDVHHGLPLWPLVLMEEEERKLMMERYRKDDGTSASPFAPEDIAVIKKVHLRLVRPILEFLGIEEDRWERLCAAYMKAIEDPDAMHPVRKSALMDLKELNDKKERNELTASDKKLQSALIERLRTTPEFNDADANEAVQYFDAAYQFALNVVADDIKRLSTFFYTENIEGIDDEEKKAKVREQLIALMHEADLHAEILPGLLKELARDIRSSDGIYLLYEGGTEHQMLRNCPWPNSFMKIPDELSAKYYKMVRNETISHYLHMKASGDQEEGESLSSNESDSEDDVVDTPFAKDELSYGRVVRRGGQDVVVFQDGTILPKDPQYHDDIVAWYKERGCDVGQFKAFLTWYYVGVEAGATERAQAMLSFWNTDENGLLRYVEDTNARNLTFQQLYAALDAVQKVRAQAESSATAQMKQQRMQNVQSTIMAAVLQYASHRPEEVEGDREEIKERMGNEELLDNSQLKQIAMMFDMEKKERLTAAEAGDTIVKILESNEPMDTAERQGMLKYVQETVNFLADGIVAFPVDMVGFLEVYERYDLITKFEELEDQ